MLNAEETNTKQVVKVKRKKKPILKCCNYLLYPLKQISDKQFYHLFYDFILAEENTSKNLMQTAYQTYKHVNEIEINESEGMLWSNLLDKSLAFDPVEIYCERLDSLGDNQAKQLSESLKECTQILNTQKPFPYFGKNFFQTEKSLLQYLKKYYALHSNQPLIIISQKYDSKLKSYRCTSIGTNFYFIKLQTDYLEEISRHIFQNGILTWMHFDSSQEYYEFWTNIVNSMIFNHKQHKQFLFPAIIECKENIFLKCQTKLKYLYSYNEETKHIDIKFIFKIIINPDQLQIANYLISKSKFGCNQINQNDIIKANQLKQKKKKYNNLNESPSFKKLYKQQQSKTEQNVILNSLNINYDSMPQMSRLFLQLFYQNNYEIMTKKRANVQKI